MPVFCLSLHADYCCRRSGACCTSAWPIHVEADRLPAWQEALDSARLSFRPDAASERSPFVAPADLPAGAGAVLRNRASGACVFYEGGSGLCAVHHALGHGFLPTACQHFPRRCLVERDRISVSLSHYCPTVAQMALRADVRPAIVTAPQAFVGHIALEGLDAREALPPLLRPGLLADHEGYRAWEALVVGILAGPGSPEAALGDVSDVTERLRAWTPRDGALRCAVEAIQHARATRRRVAPDRQAIGRGFADVVEACEEARASVPADLVTEPVPSGLADVDARWVAPAWPGYSRALRHFLAAHAFGNWCAYHGMGLRTVVRSLEVALAVVRVEAGRGCAAAERPLDAPLLTDALRAADLLLLHLSDPKALAARLSVVERAC
jgi:Fe-S-cluster containining protein